MPYVWHTWAICAIPLICVSKTPSRVSNVLFRCCQALRSSHFTSASWAAPLPRSVSMSTSHSGHRGVSQHRSARRQRWTPSNPPFSLLHTSLQPDLSPFLPPSTIYPSLWNCHKFHMDVSQLSCQIITLFMKMCHHLKKIINRCF